MIFFLTVTVSTSYWVLDTDYETYSLVYTCENLSDDSRASKFFKNKKKLQNFIHQKVKNSNLLDRYSNLFNNIQFSVGN